MARPFWAYKPPIRRNLHVPLYSARSMPARSGLTNPDQLNLLKLFSPLISGVECYEFRQSFLLFLAYTEWMSIFPVRSRNQASE